MNQKLRSTSIHLPESTIAEIDALATRLPRLAGAKFSRNGWIAQAIVDALVATRSRNVAGTTDATGSAQ